MLTGRKGYYSITRARTSINRLSLVLTVEFCIRRRSNNSPEYPRGRLSVVKHRQLARQVGAIGGKTLIADSITWQCLIKHYFKDKPVRCEGCHWQELRRPCTDYNISRRHRPLARFYSWGWQYPASWHDNDSTISKRRFNLRRWSLYWSSQQLW
jgi:hypothetical protein